MGLLLSQNETSAGLIRKTEGPRMAVAYVLRVAVVCIVLGKIFIPLAEKAGTCILETDLDNTLQRDDGVYKTEY